MRRAGGLAILIALAAVGQAAAQDATATAVLECRRPWTPQIAALPETGRNEIGDMVLVDLAVQPGQTAFGLTVETAEVTLYKDKDPEPLFRVRLPRADVLAALVKGVGGSANDTGDIVEPGQRAEGQAEFYTLRDDDEGVVSISCVMSYR